MSDSQSNFEFVYVPEEISQPLESWAQRYTETNAVECLFDRIKVVPEVARRLRLEQKTLASQLTPNVCYRPTSLDTSGRSPHSS